MQSKKEAIEILKAMIENAINCNDTYICSIKAKKGGIYFTDMFGESPIKYDETKKSISYEDIKNSIDKNTNIHLEEMTQVLSNLRDIASSSNATRVLLQDMRALLSNHTVKQVFRESQCDHTVGYLNVGGKPLLVAESAGKKNYEVHKLFYFCPDCGTKLR